MDPSATAPTQQKLSSDQFAESIKEKYPAYASVDNATLTQKMLAKYPQYSDRVDTSTVSGPKTVNGSVQGGGGFSLATLGKNIAAVPGQLVSAGKSVFNALTNHEQGLGNEIAAGIGAPTATSNYSGAVNQQSQNLQAAIQSIQKLKAQGIDTSSAEAHVKQMMSGSLGQGTDVSSVLPAVNDSTKQVAGNAFGVASDIAGAGSLSGINKIGTAKILPMIAEGAGLGYSQDVSNNLQTNKQNFLIPGVGTAAGVLGPAAIKGVPIAVGALKDSITPTLERIANGPTAQDALRAAGQVAQGTAKEAQVAARTLPKIDIQGVKTYQDLSSRLGTAIKQKVQTVENEFSKDVTPRKLPQLTQTVSTDVGGKTLTGKVNYVQNALKQLGELYQKTGDIESSLKIQGLTQKANKIGLTPTEINDLAKEYGSNFKSKGFSKTGEPLTTVSDQAYENTRSGLKGTARGFLASDAAKNADKDASDLIKTKDLADKMAQKVNALEQRIKPRNIVEKIGRAAGQAIDLATFGGPRAFVTKLLFPSAIGVKQMTSLDIQEALAKNLQVLQNAEKAPDNVFAKTIGGLLKKK